MVPFPPNKKSQKRVKKSRKKRQKTKSENKMHVEIAFGARCTKLSVLGHGGVDLFHRDIRKISLLTILKEVTKRHNRKTS